ncbi:MAG: hypothetical protein KC731_09600 [Myxococcales bacterium]|nr:hypothetical protein [Myxococcales bacterium]
MTRRGIGVALVTLMQRAANCRQPDLIVRIDRALERGRDALLALQGADGSWEGRIEVGPIAVATQLVLERCLGRLSTEDAIAGAAALGHEQLADGSFGDYPGARQGSITVTALAAAALRGVLGADGVALRAERWLAERGGFEATARAFRERGDVTALYLCAAGFLSPERLPQIPATVVLTPGLERLADGRVHAGNLMALVVLTAVTERWQSHEGSRTFSRLLAGVVRGVHRERAIQILHDWQNPSGGWNEALFSTQLMTLGLHALGVPLSDPRMSRALEWLDARKSFDDGRLLLQAIPNDIWSTAQAALALLDAGDRDSPELGRAIDHLLASQHQDPQPRANQRRRGAVRVGGWAFQRHNPTMPDCDDTGLVLAALGGYGRQCMSRPLLHAVDRGLAWLSDMQNPDGGWPAYVWNLPGKRAGAMFGPGYTVPSFDDPRRAVASFIAPPPELGDPATEGVTARVLLGLGACQVGRDDPRVCAAIDFLKTQQCQSGAFWDRWMTCYLPGTATVISGLRAVGEDMRARYVERAIDWMVGCQNDDGGFGETPAAFTDIREAGRGPSMPAVTGFVLAALVDAGLAEDPRASAAASYLLEIQGEEGLWRDAQWVNPYVPPETFYRYALPSQCTPLGALGKLRRALSPQ